jgi:hypothetical protein
MFRVHPLHEFRGHTISLGVAVITAWVLLATVPMASGQNPAPPPNGEALSSPNSANVRTVENTSKQEGEPTASNLEKTRTDAAELSALADQLRDELNKMTFDVFALDILQKTEKVEKLAKKIKGQANGYLKLNPQPRQGTPQG